MNYVEHLNLFGIDAKEIPCIKSNGSPTTATEGAIGMFYMDIDTGATYKCTAVTDGGCTWIPTGEKIDIVQSTGDSGTAVMSQKAVTESITQARSDLHEKISKNDKRIANLEKGLAGELFETDAASAHVKNVPENALPYAEITKIGGITQRVNVGTEEAPEYVLRSAPVTQIESAGVNLFDINSHLNTEHIVAVNGYEFIHQGVTSYSFASIPVTAGETYTVSGYFGGKDNSSGLRLGVVNGKEKYAAATALGAVNGVSVALKKASITFTAQSNMISLCSAGNTCREVILVEGEAEANSYTPYVHDTFTIPEEVRSIEGYGEGFNNIYHNSIQWHDDGKVTFNRTVRRVVFDGSETEWKSAADSNGAFYMSIPLGELSSGKATVLCSHYVTSIATPKPVPCVCISGSNVSMYKDFVFYPDDSITSVDEWKAYLAEQYDAGTPVTILYAIPAAETTDITDLVPSDTFINVAGGGTVTFVNEHGYDVPSEITYMLKEESV